MPKTRKRPTTALGQIQFDYDRYKDAYADDYDDPEVAFRAGVADGLAIAANALGYCLRTGGPWP